MSKRERGLKIHAWKFVKWRNGKKQVEGKVSGEKDFLQILLKNFAQQNAIHKKLL